MKTRIPRRRASAAGFVSGVFLPVFLLASCSRTDAPAATAPPLVLLVSIDTLRADRLGCYGGGANTPAIDAIAARGLRFERAYSPCPLTGPSHASLLTGLEPPEHGVRDNGVALPADVPTLAEVLAAAGYETAAFVGAAPLDERLGFARGFATYDGAFRTRPGSPRFDERTATEVTAAAARFIGDRRTRNEKRPLFLFLHFFDPHAPYEPKPPFDREKSRYDGEIASVDAALKEFLTLLELDGLLGPESLLLVLSDHGEALGEHGEATHGLLVHDATLRVPLVIAGGGVERGGAIGEPVSLLDVAPTVAALAGARWPGPLSGRRLPSRRAPEGSRAERDLYAESYFAYFRYRWAGQRALRSEAWKWVDGGPDRALFDTAADPGESTDRSAAAPEEAARLGSRLGKLERAFAASARAGRAGTVNLEAFSYGASPASAREAASLPPEGNDALPGVSARLPLLARLEEAIARLDAKDPAAARSAAASVVESDPGNPDALLTLGRAERDLGRAGDAASFAAAEAALRRAVALRPTDPGIRNTLVQTLALAGRDADALAAAEAAESAQAADAATALLAGDLLARPDSPVHDRFEAERRYRLALERDPENEAAKERLRRR